MTENAIQPILLLSFFLALGPAARAGETEAVAPDVAGCESAITKAVSRQGAVEGLAALDAARAALALCDRESVAPELRVEALLIGVRLPELTGAQKLEIAERAETLVGASREAQGLAYRVSEELSHAHFLLGHREESIALLRQAWAQRQDRFGYGNPGEIEGQVNLAAGLLSLAEYPGGHAQLLLGRAEAEGAFSRALASYGRGHEVTVAAAIGLRAILEALGDTSGANRLWANQIASFVDSLATEEDERLGGPQVAP